MSCLELSDSQRRTLNELLADEKPTDQETVDVLRRWGWVMPGSLELTGMGLSHAGDEERRPGVL